MKIAAVRKNLDKFSESEREQIAFWSRTIKEWLSRRDNEVHKGELDKLFVSKVKYDNPNIEISIDILYRKYRAYINNDLEALVDKRGGWNRDRTVAPQHKHTNTIRTIPKGVNYE